MSRIKLSEIAALAGGTLTGGDCEISGAASLSGAKEGDITFVLHKKYLKPAESSAASAFVVAGGVELPGRNCIVVKNGSAAQAKILSFFYPPHPYAGRLSERAFISPESEIGQNVTVMDFAYVSDGVVLGEGCVIFPFSYIGRNAKIGKNTRVYPHAVVMDDTEVGNDVILYPGAVIGSDGFGYVFDGGRHLKIPQVGRVVIEDNVEIGANSTIDRAAMDLTKIGEGTKIDNLVMVGHNVKMGKNCIMAGQAGIAGSTELGDMVIMGGQSGVGDHLIIEDNVMIAGGAGVAGDVKKGEKVAGFPAFDYMKWLKVQSIIQHLPDMRKKLNYLFKKFGEKEE